MSQVMFRFTIRDLLWLTVVVGISIGWYVDNRRKWVWIDRLQDEAGIHANHLPPMPWHIWIRDKLGFYRE